jgi:heme-degrading monooxygenase HmoA
MIAVIFEARPRDGQHGAYLSLAAALRPELEKFDGFVSIERFESLSEPGKLLSLSIWRDEQAVAAWRRFEQHRAAQRAGRESIFADYRLRVAEVLRDYGMSDRQQAPSAAPCGPPA